MFWKAGNKAYLGNHTKIYSVKSKDYSYKDLYQAMYFGVIYYNAVNLKKLIIIIPEVLINKYKTLLELHHKEGGLIKTWWYNQESENPLSKIKIALVKKGSGAGTIDFAYLDIPIEAEDFFFVYFQGECIYKGFVNNDADISNPKISLEPYHKRFEELLYSHNFEDPTDQSVILQDIIETLEPDTGVHWNPSKVKLDAVEPLVVNYDLEFADKVLDEIIKYNQNKYWGVDIDNDFYVKEDELIKITKRLYNCDDAFFHEVDAKAADYSKIKATEYAVSQKQEDASGSVFIGFVGNDGNSEYPPLEIRNKIRKIQDKKDITEVLSSATALKFAYADLQQNAKPKASVQAKGINLEQYRPKIGDRVLAEGNWEKLFIDINKCENTINWNNTTINTSGIGKNKTNCIRLFYPVYNNISYLDLLKNKQWYKQEKIGFWVKNTSDGERYIEVGFTNDLDDISYTKIFCRLKNVWEWYSIKFEDSFQYIVFKNTDGMLENIYVDEIQMLCTGKKQYIEPVSEISLSFTNDEISCGINLGDLSEEESDELFELRRKIRILEHINQI